MSSIVSISTLPGTYPYKADEISYWMKQVFTQNGSSRKLNYIMHESGIKNKYSVLSDFSNIETNEKEFYGNEQNIYLNPGIVERMDKFEKPALTLGCTTANKCIEQSGLKNSDITHIIAVTCTGISAPGLEIQLSIALELSPDITRYAVNFMGCYAAFHAIKLADMICKTEPDSKVLIVCVELCSLHFRNITDNDNLRATALFSDGAAALLICGDKVSESFPYRIQFMDFATQLIAEGKQDMTWNLGAHGFEMKLSNRIPDFIRHNINSAFDTLTEKNSIKNSEIEYYAIHPGGKSILKAFQEALKLDDFKLAESFEVLQKFGNMSSPTVLFVLEKIIKKFQSSGSQKAYVYGAAFGPGLTVESSLMLVEAAC